MTQSHFGDFAGLSDKQVSCKQRHVQAEVARTLMKHTPNKPNLIAVADAQQIHIGYCKNHIAGLDTEGVSKRLSTRRVPPKMLGLPS